MTAWQELAARLRSDEEPGGAGEPSSPWDQAPAPAQVARRMIEGVFYRLPWTYPPAELALDVSYHLVYGTATAAGWRLLAGRG
jgi:hypothetical protein